MLERVSTLDAPASGEHQKVEGTARPSASESRFATVGAWFSRARAPGSGPGGRWFKSTRPDHLSPLLARIHRQDSNDRRDGGPHGFGRAAHRCRTSEDGYLSGCPSEEEQVAA